MGGEPREQEQDLAKTEKAAPSSSSPPPPPNQPQEPGPVIQPSVRRFPIQGELDNHPESRRRRYIPPCTVPWSVAERAYAVYDAKWRTGQSMERLAERGGFGRIELLWLLEGAPETQAAREKDYLAQPLPGEEPHA